MAEAFVNIHDVNYISELFGSFDENARLIEKEYDVILTSHNDKVKISGEEEDVKLASKAIDALVVLIKKGESIGEQNIRYVVSLVADGDSEKIENLTDDDCVCISSRGRPIKPKTLGQKKYIESIRDNTVTISVGPAGTGKTYLAVAMAVTAFRAKQVNRIILTRPAVEAGEKLGF